MITVGSIRNSARLGGYDHVHRAGQHPGRWRAVVYGGKLDTAGTAWRGPVRNTPLDAAQDYCDHANGNPTGMWRPLRTAGHTGPRKPSKQTKHPKLVEADRLRREAMADISSTDDNSGYVYCIGENRSTVAVKVGKSKDHPQHRLGGLQTGNPRLLVVLGYIETDDRHELERKLHAKYANLNLLQEWFRPTRELLSEFKLTLAAVQRGNLKEAKSA